jgi:Tol biopolymer transport system component
VTMSRPAFLLLLVVWLTACGAPTADSSAESQQTLPAGDDALIGSLVYIEVQPGKVFLQKLAAATGQTTTLFNVPETGWLSYAAVSPDGNQVVLAYAPPPPPGQIQLGYSNLYITLADGDTTPRPLLEKQAANEIYFNPVWSPDGRFIYYTHIVPNPADAADFTVMLERRDFSTGETAVIADNAIWPRLSPDGAKLAYVTVYPAEPANELIIADADGTNPVVVVPWDAFLAVDAPVFAPDGRFLYFSGSLAESVSRPGLDGLLGVKTAAAHDYPSDWWRVPVEGGEPERLTTRREVGLNGMFAPDGRRFAFGATTGLYVMQPDGGHIQRLGDMTIVRSVSWIP